MSKIENRKVEIQVSALGRGVLKVDGVDLSAAVSGIELVSTPGEVSVIKLKVLPVEGLTISAEAKVLIEELKQPQEPMA